MILSVTNNSNHNNIVESSTPLQIKKFMETFVTNINSLINNINITYNKNQLISYQISILINSFTNQIEFIHVSEKALVAINVNLDETSKKTQQILLFGGYDIP
jgi:hypothetical protein